MSMSVYDDVHSKFYIVLLSGQGEGAYLELVLASLGGWAGVEEIDSENLCGREAVSIMFHQRVSKRSWSIGPLVGRVSCRLYSCPLPEELVHSVLLSSCGRVIARRYYASGGGTVFCCRCRPSCIVTRGTDNHRAASESNISYHLD